MEAIVVLVHRTCGAIGGSQPCSQEATAFKAVLQVVGPHLGPRITAAS